ncbi:MAG: ATP-binding protein [Clostridia bacterium]|nr:ATP-binding protein [Clostridia bacterium]
MASEWIARLEEHYRLLQERSRQEESRRRAQAEAECPELAETLAARQQMVFRGVQQMLAGQGDAVDLPGKMETLNRKIRDLLRANGHPEDWLEPVYACAKCRDTGFTGENPRTECDCRRRLRIRLQTEDLGVTTQGHSFETFDPEVFPDDPLEGGLTQRQLMCVYRDQLRNWASEAPEVPDRTIVLSGKSGLGKTYLLHCIADALMRRGVPCVLTSAFQSLTAFRRAEFDRDDADWQSLCEVQVLLLDDLGSEPLYQNVTVEQFYQLIEQRMQARLCTVISTNLTKEELKSRYTERIASRLTDRRQCNWMPLKGVDIRRRG